MSEVEKMYENAGISKKRDCEYSNSACERLDFIPCELCAIKKDMSYPAFTAEKQIELIKFVLKNYEGVDISKGFEESLAETINELWAEMPEEEKQQIKEILG